MTATYIAELNRILQYCKGRDYTEFPTADVDAIVASGATARQAAVAIVATERPNYEGPYAAKN